MRVGLALLLVLLGATRAVALPTLDSQCANGGFNNTTISCALTVGGVTNGALTIVVHTTGATVSVATLTVNGVSAISGLVGSAGTSEAVTRLYYKLAPSPGVVTVAASTTGTPQGLAISAQSWGGVSQVTPFGTPVPSVANSTAVSSSITGTANDLIVQWITWATAGESRTLSNFGAGQALHTHSGAGNAGAAASSKQLTGATTMTATLSATSDWAALAVLLNTASSDTQAPTIPTDFGVAAAGTTQINGSWTSSTDNVNVCRYRYERCVGAVCVNFVEIGQPTVNSFTDTGLASGTLYRYRVRADDCTNLSGYSAVAETTTLAPQNVDILFDDQQPDGANAETGFIINCKAGVGGTYTQVATPGASTGSGATVTYNYTAAPSPTVCCQVAATNSGGTSTFLGGAEGVCFTPPPPILTVAPATLTYTATVGGSNPAPRTITVGNPAGSGMNWTVFVDVVWLACTPTTGTDAAQLTCSVNITGLTSGTHNNTVTITAPGATGSPVEVGVTLSLSPATSPSSGRGGRIR